MSGVRLMEIDGPEVAYVTIDEQQIAPYWSFAVPGNNAETCSRTLLTFVQRVRQYAVENDLLIVWRSRPRVRDAREEINPATGEPRNAQFVAACRFITQPPMPHAIERLFNEVTNGRGEHG